jgi:hypothetical protein
MTREELDKTIGDNDVTSNHISMGEVTNIIMYVNVNLELDSGTLEHYYSINVDELLNSKMPVSDLDDLKNQGWAYDRKKENLIIYLLT